MTNSGELRRVVEDWRPDILTLDLCMPDEDGIAILSILQEIEFKGTLLIVSAQNKTMRDVAAKLGKVKGLNVTGHLEKPVSIKVLRDTLLGGGCRS